MDGDVFEIVGGFGVDEFFFFVVEKVVVIGVDLEVFVGSFVK